MSSSRRAGSRSGAVAPDGSPVEVYRRFPPGDEPAIVHGAVPAGAAILELGCGAGRLAHALVELGHPVVGVDQSGEMLRHVLGAETVLADIETLELGRRFPVVLLAGHLVNDAVDRRRAYLATGRRHLAAGGSLVLQRLDPTLDWAAHEGREQTRGGVSVTLREVRLEGQELSAVAEYRLSRRVWRQPFTSHLLDDEELRAELATAGLRLVRFLDDDRAWALARAPHVSSWL